MMAAGMGRSSAGGVPQDAGRAFAAHPSPMGRQPLPSRQHPQAGGQGVIELPGASDALKELAARGVRHVYRKGRLLIEEGDVGDALYVILAGQLRVFSANPANGREITFGSYGPGEYVGEMSLDGGPRSANVEAAEKTECALVTRITLQAFIAERPEFAFELLAKVIRRARAATLSARQMALNDVYGRLRILLETTASESGRIAMTHQQLAQRIGSSREMVSRLMKDLERGSFLQRGKDGYELRCRLPERW
jgi:CRP/FNR family transcriptional regulator, cyclic AMP receptor protein